MKALICSELCFHKTKINRFGPISWGVFLTQWYYSIQVILTIN